MFVGQICQDCAALEDLDGVAVCILIDECGDLVVGRDGAEVWLELLALIDIDEVRLLGNAQLFQHDEHLLAVRRRPIMNDTRSFMGVILRLSRRAALSLRVGVHRALRNRRCGRCPGDRSGGPPGKRNRPIVHALCAMRANTALNSDSVMRKRYAATGLASAARRN